MKPLDQFCQAIERVFKSIRSLPQNLAQAAQLRQQRILKNDFEAERLDRIRNPDKYRGK